MRITPLCIAATLALMLAACNSKPETVEITEQQRTDSNQWLVRDYQQQQINNAVARQHTIYPYQFDGESAELNELGLRDVAILARHYGERPGKLNIRRGEADAKLYRKRVEAVKDAFAAAGVDAQDIKAADDHAGGDGMASEQVLHVMTEDKDQ